ncbi:uncharacterized protein G2W53_020686 [Senna tora]|uniref:Uncharacterized protein n=1 Tax=Senna tora TaxID=362788 RepID=A0A834TJQ0_9FABA|nr:uncharacterized protein G2W53_020686 [Senna tora]
MAPIIEAFEEEEDRERGIEESLSCEREAAFSLHVLEIGQRMFKM